MTANDACIASLMRHHLTWLFAASALLTGCATAIEANQADGADCNYGLTDSACGKASFCDPGEANAAGIYPRLRAYGATRDKSHVVGTCRAKGVAGAACLGNPQCASGECVHASAAPALGAKGACR